MSTKYTTKEQQVQNGIKNERVRSRSVTRNHFPKQNNGPWGRGYGRTIRSPWNHTSHSDVRTGRLRRFRSIGHECGGRENDYGRAEQKKDGHMRHDTHPKNRLTALPTQLLYAHARPRRRHSDLIRQNTALHRILLLLVERSLVPQ